MRRRALPPGAVPAVQEFTIPYDSLNEVLILVAAMVASGEQRERLLARVPVEAFLVEEHRVAWVAMREIARKGLAFSFDTIAQFSGNRVSGEFLRELVSARPEYPENLDWHIEALMWDRRRVAAAKGSVSAFLAAFKDPTSDPAKVKALASSIAESFAGHASREHLYDSGALVRDMMANVRSRFGEAQEGYPYGIEGLDNYEDGNRRIALGAVPGQMTLLTGVSGSCKSTVSAHMALALARQRRRVLYGAWEVNSQMTLELLSVISLGWIVLDVIDPTGAARKGRPLPHDMLTQLEERAHAISKLVSFMPVKFRRKRGENSRRWDQNERNLDVVEEAIADSGCDVFIADLWDRVLAASDPEDEKQALYRQQAMFEELNVHGILVHQQRLKDIENRADKRPTREGAKGSSAYVDTAYNMFGTHRPAQWKRTPDDKLEIIILKQKLGPWPIAVEFDWDKDRMWFGGGRSIEYDPPGTQTLDPGANMVGDVGFNIGKKGGNGKKR